MTTKPKPKVLPPDPEDDYLPPWDEIKHGYSKEYLDWREKFIAEKLLIIEQTRAQRHRK